MAFGTDAWYAATEDGLLVSRDRGLNWSTVSPRARAAPAAALPAVSTASIRAVRTGNGNSYVWALTSRQLEVSGDGGKTWISRTLPFEPRGSLHLHPADENTVVLASDHGVFVSRDAGESWHQANLSELSIDDLAAGPKCRRRIDGAGNSVPFPRCGQDLGTYGRSQRGGHAFRFALARSGKPVGRGVRHRGSVCAGDGLGIVRVRRFGSASPAAQH